MTRQIHLGLFLLGTGSHVSGWRMPEAVTSFQDVDAMLRVAAVAERGLFDLIFIGDNLYADVNAHPSYTVRFEPLTLLSAMSAVTKHIGLGATVATSYSEPFTTARAFASLDHLSKGRAAWNVVTGASPAAAPNFGRIHPNHSERYKVAREYLTTVLGLWDCWDTDAIVADRASGLYIDPAKVRNLDHAGEFFQVKGPLNIGRTPQGRPIILQAGGSAIGEAMAAQTADVLFSVVQDFEEARQQYARVKTLTVDAGRKADDLVILPGVMPVVGRTDKEAFETLARLQNLVGDEDALALISDRLGVDMRAYNLDGPIPDIALPDTYHSFAKVLLSKATRENMTLRDLYNLTAAARGHWVLCGSPESVADTLERWFVERAADGFNIMPPYLPNGLDDFVELVVPILQKRGLFRRRYASRILRENLGLSSIQ